MRRRALLRWLAGAGTASIARQVFAEGERGEPRYPVVLPGRPLVFPRDFGAHPDYRTEWWYLTGWVRAGEREFGVQVTFFRSRTTHDERNPSRFAPKQLVLAHAAIALEGETRLRHDQRAARTGFGLAFASEADTEVFVDGWRLERGPDDRYRAQIAARDFGIALEFTPHGPPVPQGEAGFSRKGPLPRQASYYYSRPQLAVEGSVRLGASDAPSVQASGVAWLDHEWSSELLDPRAAGWDWVGLNLDDGSAMMAFRIRGRDGEVLWSHARWLADANDDSNASAAGNAAQPRFEPLRHWRSLRSGASYPVQMRIVVGSRVLELRPLFDDQELDTRASTGTIYWEGAVRVHENGRRVGRGYLELTGYAGAVRF